MTKLIRFTTGAPLGNVSSGQGDEEIQSIKTFLDDEHDLDVAGASAAQEYIVHAPGSAKVFSGTLPLSVGNPPFPSGGPRAADSGKLALLIDAGSGAVNGPLHEYDHTLGAWQRVVGGRYSRVRPAEIPAGAPLTIPLNTWTTITGYSIPAFHLNANYVYKLEAAIDIAVVAGTADVPIGLRFRLTDSGAANYDYEFLCFTDPAGYVSRSFTVWHDHTGGASGNAALVFQAWASIPAGLTVHTTNPGLTNWTGTAGRPHNLSIYEV